ncbi:MAG: tRNA (N6-isopentenyl adenosine(37)-C2)-methylthiotransferase MiaB [Bacteroidia bacterium]|nr:tRNA (N6-isopentenyl adenosine(37)-C2)-methylthiotransferase MiaB [Bacteroidia bacterium]
MADATPYTQPGLPGARGLAYIETYGCQMNFSDTEIVAASLAELGYGFTHDEAAADVVLLNTCAIRENAEQKVWHRLAQLKGRKRRNPDLIVGLLGCMAERLKKQVLEDAPVVDLVVGPDAYRDLPTLLAAAEGGQKAVNVLLSREETYADLAPIRLNTNGVSAFVSIMRGCDNMCAFCVVPFTRGRERSRDVASIVRECEQLVADGYREVTLLGQNVDSYRHEGTDFADLLARVAEVSPLLRVRFSTSHPKDLTERVAQALAAYPNVCNFIHLPVQSGSSRILEKMNRGYTRDWYLDRLAMIRSYVPEVGLSTDIISGYCSETEEDHQATLSLMAEAGFDSAFMFAYSERPGTLAARKYPDDVPAEVKQRRLAEIIELQGQLSVASNRREVGRVHTVLVEGTSKRSVADLCGRTDTNKLVVFATPDGVGPGDYVQVQITETTRATLIGSIVERP